MLSVFMLSVILVSVVAPKIHFNKARELVVGTARQTDKAGELIR